MNIYYMQIRVISGRKNAGKRNLYGCLHGPLFLVEGGEEVLSVQVLT